MTAGKNIYLPIKKKLYLTDAWYISIKYQSGNFRFIEKNKLITGALHDHRYGFLPVGQEFEISEIYSNGLKSPLNTYGVVAKISVPYRTKRGFLSKVSCYITLGQLRNAFFSEEKVDCIFEKPNEIEFDLDRFGQITPEFGQIALEFGQIALDE